MADVMRLRQSGGTVISFSPILDGRDRPDSLNAETWFADDGTPFVYKSGNKERYELRLNNVSYADALQFNTWAINKNRLAYTPDLIHAGAATIGVYILNETLPFQMFNWAWRTLYSGTLQLYEE